MKNITITMEDAAAEWVRIEAAKRNTSISRMVGQMLADQMRQEDAYDIAMREALQFKSFGPSTGPYLTRDEMYDRANFR